MSGKKLTAQGPVAEGAWYDTLPRSTRLPTIGGVLIMAVMVMGFGVWGNMAPIAGAVVASGVFVATGQNKIIQHLEGGVIREIWGKETSTHTISGLVVRMAGKGGPSSPSLLNYPPN